MTTLKTTMPKTPKRPKRIAPKLTPKQRPAQTCLKRDLPLGWEKPVLPPNYGIIDGGAMFLSADKALQVIESIGVEQDGKRWQHLSVLRFDARGREQLPSWSDLVMVKRLFSGHDTDMLQIIPRSQKHVSINNYVLHLWRCLDDDDVLPDFTRGQKQI